MRAFRVDSVIKITLAAMACIAMHACTPTPTANVTQSNVASAFESSSVMTFKPYTRTIFSTTDF